MSDTNKCYRCGYCGQPTNKRGDVLSLEQINQCGDVDWDDAEPTHGDCCVEQMLNYEIERLLYESQS